MAAAKFNPELTNTGNRCPNAGIRCFGDGYAEFCGLCPQCWAKCDIDQRKALLEARDLNPVVYQTHNHEHRYPPQSRLITTTIAYLAGSIGGAVFVLAEPWMRAFGHAKGWW
jgi:hypothetical protein